MAHTTTRRGLRVPDLADNPDIPRDITNLATDIDTVMAAMTTGTIAARPATAQKDGDIYWATDDLTMSANGTPYKWDATNGAWRLWAPASDPIATQAGSRTLGTGAQQAASGADTRLSDARTPLAHAASHRPGGADALASLPLSVRSVLDLGIANQVRAGRIFTLADFTTLMGLSAPVGLWNLADLTDISGNARSLTNKGAVTFGGNGIAGSNAVAQFTGSTAQALYIADTGVADPFRIKTGSWGAWFKTGKRGVQQAVIGKWRTAQQMFVMTVEANNTVTAYASLDGSTNIIAAGSSDVADDRWHFAVCTWDGTDLRTYVDGVLEGITGGAANMLFSGSAPLNIGGYTADSTTAATSPFFGKVDEAFVTADVLSDDQVRLLYAAKVAHGSSVTPNAVNLSVRRRRRGPLLTAADFPTSPRRLYNLNSSFADLGLDGANLSPGGGPVAVAGPDGAGPLGAMTFVASGAQSASATDTGLPSGTASGSMGCWFKASVTPPAVNPLMNYGTAAAARRTLSLNTGSLAFFDGATATTGPLVKDGQWHFAFATWENAPLDGQKVKLYLDGRLVAASTTLNAGALNGANSFTIAKDYTTNYATAQIARAFVTDYVLTPEAGLALYAKGSQTMPASPKNEGDNVEAIDATNLYLINDSLSSADQIDVRVAA